MASSTLLLVASIATLFAGAYAQSLDPTSLYKGVYTEAKSIAKGQKDSSGTYCVAPDLNGTCTGFDYRVQPNPYGAAEQVLLFPSDNNSTSMVITWSTAKTLPSIVYLSTDGWATYPTTFNSSVQRTVTTFPQVIYGYGPAAVLKYADYTSGYFHKVNLTALTPGTTYYYRIGKVNPFFGQFTVPPLAGVSATLYPFTMGIIGDNGQTNYSVATMKNIFQPSNVSGYITSPAQCMLFMGDFSYADGYQPRWDIYNRFMSYYMAGDGTMAGNNYTTIPFLYTYGNHELEFFANVNAAFPQYGFQRVDAQYGSAAAASTFPNPAQGNQYWSTNIGPVHVISMNFYIPFTDATAQNGWIQADLALAYANKKNVPWVVAVSHVPWYNSYTGGDYLLGEGFRTAIEHYTRTFQVDFHFHGHVHAYERFVPLYQWANDPCGTVHMIMGHGGNHGSISSTKGRIIPLPAYVATQDPHYGSGVLTFLNASTALFVESNCNNFATLGYCPDYDIAYYTSKYALGTAVCGTSANPITPAGTNTTYSIPYSASGFTF